MVEVKFPNESASYRTAREELLKAEIDLRARVEDVARRRRELPVGGALKEDYVFDELVNRATSQTALSQILPPGKDTLFVYSFMYGPEMEAACPMCTSLLDGLDGQVTHIDQRIGFVVVAKNPIDKLRAHAVSRGWKDLRLLSSSNNSYNADYYGEIDGHQMSMINVFTRDPESSTGFRHFWGSEMVFSDAEPGQNMRHTDMLWPLWNVLDMTPEGRGDWYPELSYSQPITLGSL